MICARPPFRPIEISGGPSRRSGALLKWAVALTSLRIVTWYGCRAAGRGVSLAARPAAGWDRAYPSSVGTVRPAHLESRLELADVGRLARRVLRRAVVAARTEDAPVQRALWEHLGPQAADVPVVRATWPGYDRVNVQVGLDAWLAGPGRRHELAGVTRVPPRPRLAHLIQNEDRRGGAVGPAAPALPPVPPAGGHPAIGAVLP